MSPFFGLILLELSYLSSFWGSLHYLGDLRVEEVREGEAIVEIAGAVQIMTVHKAKGLEFPIVIIANASGGTRLSETEKKRNNP